MARRLLAFVAALCLFVTALAAQVASGPVEATPQRPSFSTDTSTTAPGTVELELGTATSNEFFGLPTTMKFTPDVEQGPLTGMEFSVGFDSISSVDTGDRRVTQFGDRIGFAVRRALYQGERFSFAVAPQSVFFLRGAEGTRLGAAAIAVYAFDLSSVVVNVVWSAATSSSEENPARQTAFIAGYSRAMGRGPVTSRFAVFGEYQQEFSSGDSSKVSLMEGVSYRLRPNLVLDVAAQQDGLAAGTFDLVLVGGVTYNLGRFF